MAEELIVDFPTHPCNRSRSSKRSVQFADTSLMYIVGHHDDNEGVDRHDLWYNKQDYSRMRLAIQKSVLKVRAMASAGVAISYSGDNGSLDDCLMGIFSARMTHAARNFAPASYSGDNGSLDDCLMGIEHLLTPESALEVKACRARCVRAVLQEQARQKMNPSAMFAWESIAAASFAETRKAAVRARKLGKLHKDSI